MEQRARRCLKLLLFSIVCFLSAVEAIPVPSTYDGFSYVPHTGVKPVLLEGFIDPLCIDCKSAWPTVAKVLKVYGSKLSFIVHTFPAPFHHNAFFSARVLHIADSLNSSAVFPLLQLIFDQQNEFLNDATNDEAPASVVSRFGQLAEKAGLSGEKVARGFTDSRTDQAARISFKYGCSRHVTSTPTFLVNGIKVSADETWTFEEWTKLLDPLFTSAPVTSNFAAEL